MVGASLKLAGRYILNGCKSVPQLHHGKSVQFHRNCRGDSANSLFYKQVRSNILPLFPWIHIQHSTFHQADCGDSPQSIR